MATVKLTRKLLERIIKEERQKLSRSRLREDFGKPEDVQDRADDTEEVEADEYGTDKTLENPIDHMKALKIRESAFEAALVKLAEARAKKAKGDKSKKDEAAKKKADDAKKAKAKKEAQDKSKKKPKSKKTESVRSVKMNEAQLVEALQATRAKMQSMRSKTQKKG